MTNTPKVGIDPIHPPLMHENHGGNDDIEDNEDATDQDSTSQSYKQPSSDDDEEVGNDDDNDNPPDSQLVVKERRSERGHISSSKHPPNLYVLMTDTSEPSCYEEEMSDEHKNERSEAMHDEMKSAEVQFHRG